MSFIIYCILVLCVCQEYAAVISWTQGNWALGCDFYGNDWYKVTITSDKCGVICAERSPCSHFTWYAGTCYLKTGPIKKENAVEKADKTFVCGFNSRAVPQAPVPQAPVVTKTVTIRLWEHSEFQGQMYSFELKAKQCFNLYSFNDKASSINTNGACVYIYEHDNCQGQWDQVSPVSFSHNNLRGIGFNDKMSSIEFCTNYANNVEPSWWLPTFNFDGKAECYPAHPVTNGRCLGFDSKAPAYYEGRQCGSTYRLQYWIFYGWQNSCTDIFDPIDAMSTHDNDWEHVTVNFRSCDGTWCISSVTFAQHNGWYTRKYKGQSSLNSYVGKFAHGNYFDTCCGSGCDTYCAGGWFWGIQCMYYEDFRNPGISWIPEILYHIDAAARINQKIRDHGSRDSCSLDNCRKDGCDDNESDI